MELKAAPSLAENEGRLDRGAAHVVFAVSQANEAVADDLSEFESQ